MMRALYKEEGASLRIGILAEPAAQEFIGLHSDTLNNSFQQVEMSDIMRKRLSRSNYVFSGMKAFHELNESFPSLVDENGNRKTFERFLKDVQSIDDTYNSNYLRSEYNFVQSSAEMAAKWESFMQDGDRYYLQYRTANDGKVRPEHAVLHGVTLPITDSFWEEYYPPNGWNCRCTVVQVRKSRYPATPHDEAMALGEEALQYDTKGMFRFNPGKQEKSVPDYNPYTISRCRDCDIAKGKAKLSKTFIPDNELCQACRLIREMAEAKECLRTQRKEVKEWAKENLAGKTVLVQGVPGPVEFTMTGIKETLNQPHKYARAKNEALRHIVALMQEGKHVLEKVDDKRNPMVRKYHYVRISVAGKPSFAVIRELMDGRCQFYSIVEKLKKKESD